MEGSNIILFPRCLNSKILFALPLEKSVSPGVNLKEFSINLNGINSPKGTKRFLS